MPSHEYEMTAKLFLGTACAAWRNKVFYCSFAIAAPGCPLFTTFRAERNGFHRAGSVPAPQMLREGKSMKVSLAKANGAQQCVHLTLGSLRVLQAFSSPQPFSHRTASRRPPQRR
jgi:hypothetical protein